LKNKCSVWKRIKFPTFWYNCYYFTWSDTYFIQFETLLINHPSYIPQHPNLEHNQPMLLLLCGRPSITLIPENGFAFYSCIISLSIFLFPAKGFYLLSPFVFSSIFPFCLILVFILAKGPLSLKYPALSLLEETYCLHLQGYISPHLILGLLNPF